jgi:PAS domain S-box-containing protein
MNSEKAENMEIHEEGKMDQDKGKTRKLDPNVVDSRIVNSSNNNIEQSERAEVESQRILSTLLDNLPGMTYRCRNDHYRTMDFVSEGCQNLTGYLPDELILNKKAIFGQLIHPSDRISIKEIIDGALFKKKTYDIVYRINTKNREEKWVRELGCGVYTEQDRLSAIEGFIFDVSDRVETESRIMRQVQRFEALRKIDLAITGSFDLRVILDILLDQVVTLLDVDAADVLLFNPYTHMLEYAVGRGFDTNGMQKVRLRLGEGLAGVAVLERRVVQIYDLSESMNKLTRKQQIQDEKFISYFGVPLIAKGQVRGILEVFHREPFNPDHEWLEFLEALGAQAVIAVDNKTMFDNLQRSNMELAQAYDATLESLSKALELRDQETEGHTRRVMELTIQLARAVKVNEIELVHIRRGALLHDIGKVGVPDNILFKPGPLSDDEWDVMRRHPVYAYELLSAIIFLRPALDIPYCHHEKWDGSGYPRGLSGDEIPIAARIFAVVDVWDALLSKRPYRPPWPENDVLEYLQDQSGKHFDPNIVDLFMMLLSTPSIRDETVSYT